MVSMSELEVNVADEGLADTYEYLTFSLGQEYFGVDILKVQEIMAWEDVTRIPNSPDYVMGVLNLRGSIVPVYDLRLRLGMEFVEYHDETVVIILRVLGDNGERNIGVAVDEVSDVLLTSSHDIKEAPDFGGKLNTDFISGMASAGEKVVTLLSADMLQPIGQQARIMSETMDR
jgi:purine-binding chemotaxis protein CheW